MKILKGFIIVVVIMVVIYIIARLALGSEWFDRLYGEEALAAETYKITYAINN